jgi:hypothetical protein
MGDLDPVPQVEQALGVGRHRHAEADDRDAALRRHVPLLAAFSRRYYNA